MLGDGELQEGEVWEGAMFSAHHNLDNLCAIIDYNKMQSDNLNENIMGLEPLTDKWKAFGWEVYEIDGHSSAELEKTFTKIADIKTDKPKVVIARTIKGQGVSITKGHGPWHHKIPNDEEMAIIMKELS